MKAKTAVGEERVSWKQAGTGNGRWAGLLVANFRDEADWDNGRCLTRLIGLAGNVVAEVKWSSRVTAAHQTSLVYNDLRALKARRELTPEDVVRVFQTYAC